MKPLTIAVDDGFAYTKIALFDDKGKIYTTAEPTYIKAGDYQLTSFSGNDALQTYECEGLLYTAGHATEHEDTRFDEYPYSPSNTVMVHHVLHRAGVPEGVHIHLGASVPMGMFYNKQFRETMLERRKKSLMRPVNRFGASSPYLIESVDILPESASSYIDFVMTNDGKEVYPRMPQMAIIDIGGRTTDIAVMLEGNLIDNARSGTEKLGVLDLLNNLVERVQNDLANQMNRAHPIRLTLRLAENLLIDYNKKKEAILHAFGKDFDVTHCVEQEVRSFISRIYQSAQRRIEDISSQMDMIAITGGGAVLTQAVFRESYPNIMVPEQPQYTNARGMLKYMTYLSA